MVKFRLKGKENNTWPVKIKKVINGQESTEKLHLRGNTDHDSDKIGLPIEELKRQLGDVMVWYEGEGKV